MNKWFVVLWLAIFPLLMIVEGPSHAVSLKKVGKGLKKSAGGVVGGATGSVSGAASGSSGLLGIPGTPKTPIDSVGDAIGGAADTVGGTVGGAADTVGGAVGGAADTVGEGVEGTAGTVGEGVEGTAGTVGEGVEGTAGTIGEGFEGAVEGGSEGFSDDSTGGVLDALPPGGSFLIPEESSSNTNDDSSDGDGVRLNKNVSVGGSGVSGGSDATSSSALSLTPPASDYSVSFLANLFGVVDGVLHGTGSQIMGAIFSVFNSAVLALGGIVIMYTLIVGTMNTAHEGEMLGRKWSSIWIPVRSTAGLALLIPKASGYCLMQIFVMWVVVQGVGAADKVWNAALNYLNRGGVIIQASMNPAISIAADSGKIGRGAGNLLASEVCMLGLQKTLETARKNLLAAAQTPAKGPCGDDSVCNKEQNNEACFCGAPVPDLLATVDVVAFQAARSSTTTSTTTFDMPVPYFAKNSSSSYAFLEGICGNIRWNALSLTDIKGLSLSSADVQLINLSRATAIQQMYMDYQMAAQAIVNNDPQIVNPNTTSTSTHAFDHAINVFGVSSSLSSSQPCSYGATDCVLWLGGSGNKTTDAPLFNGTELQNGIADYNAVMMPTLNLINNVNKDKTAINARKFIADAQNHGWLTAGSYFFDLVALNSSSIASQNLTDTDSGFERSDGGLKMTACAATANENGNYDSLCTWLKSAAGLIYEVGSDNYKKYSTMKLDNINQLLGTSLKHLPFAPGTMDSIPTSDALGSTVFGFVRNSSNMQLPGQPIGKGPSMSTSLFPRMQKANYDYDFPKPACNGFRLFGQSICIGGYIMSGIYDMIKAFSHTFTDILAVWINNMVIFVISIPLATLESVFKTGVEYLTQHPEANPIVALAQMGVHYINAPANLYVGMITQILFANLVPFFGTWIAAVLVTLLGLASPLIISWMGVMLAIGFVTAFYVPFLPYMIFTFGVIGWLTAVIEAMAAAPMVALAVTHPEGEGILGNSGEKALMILMNVFLRPAMMIIGYIAAIALCYVSVWIINTGFSHVLHFIQGSIYTGWAGLYVMFFSVVIYTSMYVTVTQKAFNLIYMLPDHVLRWIGGHEEHVGQEAAGWAQESQKHVEKAGEASEKGQAAVLEKTVGEAKKKYDQLKAASSSADMKGGGPPGGGAPPGGPPPGGA